MKVRLAAAAILLAFASVAQAAALRLIAPRNGVTLRGGSFAEVRWSAAELPAAAEEWEAFLSLDGGKYYAFRITPHLDIALQRFMFIVPNVDTHDARILIRTGDEVRESRFEQAGSFSIARDAAAEEAPLPRMLSMGRGEAARDGDPAVVAWTDGDRNGVATTQQSAPSTPSPALFAAFHSSESTDAATVVTAVGALETRAHARVARVAPQTPASSGGALVRSLDLLLVCSRMNV